MGRRRLGRSRTTRGPTLGLAPVAMSGGTDENDRGLLERIRTGDREAFAELYDRHSSAAYSLALVLARDRATAQDLVHDTFLDVWSGRARQESDQRVVRTWLLALLRERAKEPQHPAAGRGGALRHEILRHAASSRLPQDDVAGTVATGLEALPAEEVDVLVLAMRSGLTYQEIADRMGLPHRRVAELLGRGLRSVNALCNPREQGSRSTGP